MASKRSKLSYALMHAKRGCKIIPIRADDKRPLTPNGYKDATDDIQQIKSWWKSYPKANIGIATGQLSNLFVLDVDKRPNKDGMIAFEKMQKLLGDFDTYMTATPSGGLHCYFKYPDGGIRCSIGVFEGVDVRGDGGYVLARGSEIGKKLYRSLSKSDVREAPALLFSLLKYGEKALPPLSLSEGNRNSEIFQYGCRMRQCGVPVEDAFKFAVKANESYTPPMSGEEIRQTIENAYREEYQRGTPASPAGDVGEAIATMNREFALILLGSKLSIMRFYTHYETGKEDFSFLNVQDFHNFLRNRKINGKEPASYAWLEHMERREYLGITFSPAGSIPTHIFNMWRGYGVEAVEGDCRKFLDFIHCVICGGDKALHSYVMAWLANAVQNPTKRPHVALVLYGGQGVGKSFFANRIGKLFGQHYLHVPGLGRITGRFTAQLRDKCLVFIDEATWEGQKAADQGILKDLISGESYTMEAKGHDAVELPNHMQFILASNSRNIVPTAIDERRYVMLHVSDERQQDGAYFDDLLKHMESGGYEAFLHFLLNYDLDGVDLRRIPNTDLLQQMKLERLDSLTAYWLQLLQRGYITRPSKEWPAWVSNEELKSSYSRVNNIEVDRSFDTSFGILMSKLLPPSAKRSKKKVAGENKNGWRLPSLELCRKNFCRIVGVDIEWE